jgi:hypothetical protein
MAPKALTCEVSTQGPAWGGHSASCSQERKGEGQATLEDPATALDESCARW